jgi:hypothetical protein
VRRHPPHHLSPAEQTTRQGVILWGASAAPQPAQQRSDQGRKPVISEQIVAGRAKILSSVSWVRIPLSPPVQLISLSFSGFSKKSPIQSPIQKVAAAMDAGPARLAHAFFELVRCITPLYSLAGGSPRRSIFRQRPCRWSSWPTMPARCFGGDPKPQVPTGPGPARQPRWTARSGELSAFWPAAWGGSGHWGAQSGQSGFTRFGA